MMISKRSLGSFLNMMDEFNERPGSDSIFDQIELLIGLGASVLLLFAFLYGYFKYVNPLVEKTTAPKWIRSISNDREVSKILAKFNDPSKAFSCEIVRRTGDGEGKYFDLVTTCLRHDEKITVGTYDKDLKKIVYWWTAEYYWTKCDEYQRGFVEAFRFDSKRWRNLATITHTERLLIVCDFMLSRYGPITAETLEPICSHCEKEDDET